MEKINILIAEDDKAMQQTYDCFLSGYVFEKRFTSNGQELIEAYQEQKPDLLLLDSMMPVMTGFAALKTIRTFLGDRTTPVVILTSLSKSDDVMDFVKIGITGYIVKPVNPFEVGGQILKYFEKVDAARAREAQALHKQTLKKWREEFEQKKKDALPVVDEDPLVG